MPGDATRLIPYAAAAAAQIVPPLLFQSEIIGQLSSELRRRCRRPPPVTSRRRSPTVVNVPLDGSRPSRCLRLYMNTCYGVRLLRARARAAAIRRKLQRPAELSERPAPAHRTARPTPQRWIF
ncbi:hypothetical protein EVAR_22825_1 [Eumeta japonica]|uniref:Uncharacterized protein n=1 Tax=Eumeta variegata TaxID=151549 RepID=A0A4C1VFF6_EUMVA|nr:hypothetical protein EVAR_22825_1 [Eumeta japonica]